jgi:hypothetical protein
MHGIESHNFKPNRLVNIDTFFVEDFFIFSFQFLKLRKCRLSPDGIRSHEIASFCTKDELIPTALQLAMQLRDVSLVDDLNRLEDAQATGLTSRSLAKHLAQIQPTSVHLLH